MYCLKELKMDNYENKKIIPLALKTGVTGC